MEDGRGYDLMEHNLNLVLHLNMTKRPHLHAHDVFALAGLGLVHLRKCAHHGRVSSWAAIKTVSLHTNVADLEYDLHMIIEEICGNFGYSIQSILHFLQQKENGGATVVQSPNLCSNHA